MFSAFRPILKRCAVKGYLVLAGNEVGLRWFSAYSEVMKGASRSSIRPVFFSLHGRSVIAGPLGSIAMNLKHLRKKIAALLAATIVTSATAQADMSVIRGGQENPMATVGKSTLYGAGTGLLAGAAIAALDFRRPGVKYEKNQYSRYCDICLHCFTGY